MLRRSPFETRPLQVDQRRSDIEGDLLRGVALPRRRGEGRGRPTAAIDAFYRCSDIWNLRLTIWNGSAGTPGLGTVEAAQGGETGLPLTPDLLADVLKLGVDLQIDLLAHEPAAGLHDHVPGHVPVLAVDRRPRRERGDRLAFLHPLAPAEQLAVQRDRARNVLDRQLPIQLELRVADRSERSAPERQHRVLLQ